MAGIYLGLDYGRKRIGIAVSTPVGTVHPRERLERTGPGEDIEALKALLQETGARAFVIGLPHHMDGAASEMEEEVREFAAVLAVECGVPVFGVDERLTSQAADSALRAQELHGRRRKQRRDSAAACILLGDFIDAGEDGERVA